MPAQEPWPIIVLFVFTLFTLVLGIGGLMLLVIPGPRRRPIVPMAVLFFTPFLALGSATIIAVWSLVSSGSSVARITAAMVMVIAVLLMYSWYRLSPFALEVTIFRSVEKIRSVAETYIDQAQEVTTEVEQSASQLKENIEQIAEQFAEQIVAANASSDFVPTDVFQTNIEELKSNIERLGEVAGGYKKALSETQENFSKELDNLAQRLPGSFQDMTQKEILGRLERAEKNIQRLEAKETTRTSIRLERRQVWLAIIAIIASVICSILGLLPTLWQWLGPILNQVRQP